MLEVNTGGILTKVWVDEARKDDAKSRITKNCPAAEFHSSDWAKKTWQNPRPANGPKGQGKKRYLAHR